MEYLMGLYVVVAIFAIVAMEGREEENEIKAHASRILKTIDQKLPDILKEHYPSKEDVGAIELLKNFQSNGLETDDVELKLTGEDSSNVDSFSHPCTIL